MAIFNSYVCSPEGTAPLAIRLGTWCRGYRTYFGTQSWPVFAVTTAGSFEPALGTFIGLWSDELRKALEAGGSKSLGEVQALAEARYWADNAGIKVPGIEGKLGT